MTDRVEAILKERGSTYGPFSINAHIAQDLKAVLCGPHTQWEDLTPVMREALDLMTIKLARIVTKGADPMHLDNWDDLSGYPKLVADGIRQQKAKQGVEHA